MKESTAMKGNRVVSNIAPVDNAANNSHPDEVRCHSRCESNNIEISKALDSVTAQMHGITSDPPTGDLPLGFVLISLVAVEGELVEALLDTGSPVSIIQLESLLQIWAKQCHPSQTPADWRTEVESHLEPTSLTTVVIVLICLTD